MFEVPLPKTTCSSLPSIQVPEKISMVNVKVKSFKPLMVAGSSGPPLPHPMMRSGSAMSEDESQTSATSTTYSVDLMTRVEGEGRFVLEMDGDRVVDARLSIFEAPRFFEAFSMEPAGPRRWPRRS